MRLANKTIIVTGAGSGIGQYGARLFAQEGANVVAADIDAGAVEETVKEIVGAGGNAIAVPFDVTSVDDNARLVSEAVEAFGGLHGYWANAGLTTPIRPATEQDADTFDRVFQVNAKGPWLGARAAIGELKKSEGAAFLITASLSGFLARPGNSTYSVSKGAAIQLMRSLAMEFAPRVRVNAISPVSTETPMLPKFMAQGVDVKATIQAMRDGVPLGRLATPEDVANAALFLLSDESTLFTGVNLPIDGGISARL
jgi:3-oxoacyl-[acyl-carrier protein] reductase